MADVHFEVVAVGDREFLAPARGSIAPGIRRELGVAWIAASLVGYVAGRERGGWIKFSPPWWHDVEEFTRHMVNMIAIGEFTNRAKFFRRQVRDRDPWEFTHPFAASRVMQTLLKWIDGEEIAGPAAMLWDNLAGLGGASAPGEERAGAYASLLHPCANPGSACGRGLWAAAWEDAYGGRPLATGGFAVLADEVEEAGGDAGEIRSAIATLGNLKWEYQWWELGHD